MSPATTARLSKAIPEARCEFADDVIDGLSRSHKTLPCRYLYDEIGSELFEDITRLPEYYPTRTEAAILGAGASGMTAGIEPGSVLIEFGSGSSIKTELLLETLPPDVTYVPVDFSPAALRAAQQRLLVTFPHLDVRPVVGDFTKPLRLPSGLATRPRTGFFPGSTIGNLAPQDAKALLTVFNASLSENGRGRLIIGVDLKKDARQLVLAYNDAAGVTAAFNLNILSRINRELDGRIDVQAFRHEAVYDPRLGRIEMHLVSRVDQEASICGRRFRFRAGESIHTENSYKYSVAEFRALAESAGWNPARVWTDPGQLFSVHELNAI